MTATPARAADGDRPQRELTVTGFANGGAGVAREDDGRVVFVAGALPGERVRAVLTRERSSFAQARTTEVLIASPHRIAPLCPAAAAGGGCCDLAYAEPGHAAQLKAHALADVLRRIGGLTATPPPPELQRLGDAVGWRIRMRLAVDADGGAGVLRAGSREVVAPPCAAPVPGLWTGLGGLGARPGSELVAATGHDGRRGVIELAPLPGGRGQGREAAQRRRSRRAADRAERVLDGDGRVTYRVGARDWTLPVTGFWQAHRAAGGVYAQSVRELVAAAGPRVPRGGLRVWDLYGGAGVLGAALLDGAGAGGPAIAGVELVETAPAALAAAAATLGGEPVTAHRGDVAAVLPGLHRPDVVIADPPRSGAGDAVVDAVTAAAPQAVVHVGCDAAAFARDLRRYAAGGYRVLGWRGFDAFPGTHHLEAMAVLVPTTESVD
ncbi:class I SAM-dependent RNA methyltransferase [Gordonia sp. VNK21]|uniref:class I SAM-dependent RNA methyltransferase n=1 Tax=Gordonia sp. VNK21 TaxID=3382483 RepID=UPI0038D37F8D